MRLRYLFLVVALLSVHDAALAQITYPGTRATDSATIVKSSATKTQIQDAAKRWVSWSSPQVNSYTQILAAMAKHDTVLEVRAGPVTTRTDTVWCAGTLCSRTPPVATPPPVIVTPPPATGVAPWATDDYSTYTTTTAAVSASLYIGTEHADRMTLDNAAPPVGGRSVRHDYPDRTSEGTTTGLDGRCTSYVIKRTAAVPQNVKHIWVEVWARFSTNFTTVAPPEFGCTGGNDYKFMLLGAQPFNGQYGRFSIQMQYSQWTMDLPSGQNSVNAVNSPGKPLPFQLWDGQWHRYRFEAQLSATATSSDCRVRAWVDNTQLTDDYQSSGYICNRPGFSGLDFGATLNQGPKVPSSVWWGRWAIYTQNPGW